MQQIVRSKCIRSLAMVYTRVSGCQVFIHAPSSQSPRTTGRERNGWKSSILTRRSTFLRAVCSYMIVRLPLNEPLLRYVEVVNVRGKMTAQLGDLTFFTTKCPALLLGASVDTVMDQFSLYQSTDISECIKPRLDETWSAIGHITDEDGSKPLKELPSMMVGLLVIAHSRALTLWEFLFLTVRKNRTDQAASLADETLEAMLVLKSQTGHPTDSARQLSESRLGVIKHAYYQASKPSVS